MIDPRQAQQFLELPKIAVVGASDEASNFGRTLYVELKRRGHDVVAVHPTATTVAGDPCFASFAALPTAVDGALVVVPAAAAADVVRAAAAAGVRSLWLFKGVGGEGAVSEDALAAARDAGMTVVAGACPLMFLEPVALVHRMHRAIRRLNGSLAKAS